MAWSIFKEGGGKGAAVTWAHNLLKSAGVPDTAPNVQFVYDWEVSEGGGGKFNPLNQGPDPGHPELTSTGQQFGGGAADYVSWQAGIQGAKDYLNMPAYSGVLAGLRSGSYSAAEHALWASPWAASHYGNGSNWSTEAAPGASQLAGGDNATGTSIHIPGIGDVPSPGDIANALNPAHWIAGFYDAVLHTLGIPDVKDLFQRLGLVLLGISLVIVGIFLLTDRSISGFASTTLKTGGTDGRLCQPDRPRTDTGAD